MEFDLLSWIQKDAFFTLQMLLGIVMGFSGSLTRKKTYLIIKISAVTLFAKARIKHFTETTDPLYNVKLSCFYENSNMYTFHQKILQKGIPPAREQNSL